ncbi:MAG: hypothetical protein SOW59_02165 [Corynebacterium sp.]|nr:hypothetical protein [Corynebacterium sp.]
MYSSHEMDRVLASIRSAWEGQPDLPLATLFAMAANAGIGWGAANDMLVQFMSQQAANFVPQLSTDELALGGSYLLSLSNGRLVTVTPLYVVVRQEGDFQPVLWRWSGLRTTRPGAMLTLNDEDGYSHNLGIVRRISALRSGAKTHSCTLSKPDEFSVDSPVLSDDIGNDVFVSRLTDGSTVVVGRLATVWAKKRRSLNTETLRWKEIASLTPLVFKLRDGGERHYADVDKVIQVESD